MGRTIDGVMLNAYPDSIGTKLEDAIRLLKRPEFEDAFSLFYVLPTFFNSDLDRGFSIIDYNLNTELVSKDDLEALEELNIMLKFDIVLNHLSTASPQFMDLLEKGDKSEYKDFFINWNTFWSGHGNLNEDGITMPKKEYLNKLFMRKSGLPVLKVPFPDGSEQPYWNTFYQQIKYNEVSFKDLDEVEGLNEKSSKIISAKINQFIKQGTDLSTINLGEYRGYKDAVIQVTKKNATYLGQMDVNAKSKLVWDFYEKTLSKLKSFGCKILRLDAFAYLHKEVGQSNFFNIPGTWEYLQRIKKIADRNDLLLLPEIHAEYGLGLHKEVAKRGYYIYDFFFPGLVLHAIENQTNKALVQWIDEIMANDYKTINMLGCHDGIPLLDLKGKTINGKYNKGLLEDHEIEALMDKVISRGGRVKNLYDAEGKKISYYQVNATFFSALGEDDKKLLLARAIQMFMPGIPQIWYLDLFGGKNDYEAADKGGGVSHKEINRTTLTLDDVETGLKDPLMLNQLKLIRLRNTCRAFTGNLKIGNAPSSEILDITWEKGDSTVHLKADLVTCGFSVSHYEPGSKKVMIF